MSDLELIASLQRELAEARAEIDQWRAAVRDYVHGDAVVFCPPPSLHEAAMRSVPGPSDAKGEKSIDFWTLDKANACIRGIGMALGIDDPGTTAFGIGLRIVGAIESLKSRASLTPLTDPSVRGVLVDDGVKHIGVDRFYVCADYQLEFDRCGGASVAIRPASEFGVPAEPAQKLVPLPEDFLVLQPWKSAMRRSDIVRLTHSSGEYVPVDPALYGVPVERAWDQTELHKAQCESIGLRAEVERQSERIASLTSAAETAEAEAERLRKAIDAAISELTDQGPYDRPKIINSLGYLRSALTPPTATSGENNQTGEANDVKATTETARGPSASEGAPVQEGSEGLRGVCERRSVASAGGSSCATGELAGVHVSQPPSAPAAESEGGNRRRHYFNTGSTVLFGTVDDCRQECVCESREDAGKLADALNEHSALSARLAACEERCKELEAGIEKHQRQHQAIYEELDGAEKFDRELWSLLAPKAEGAEK